MVNGAPVFNDAGVMANSKRKGGTVRVADWMSKNVFAVETFDSIAIARQVMAKHRINQLPVLDEGRLVGIVTDRDIRDAYPTSMIINRGREIDEFVEKITVEEVMTHDVFMVRPDTGLEDAVRLLRRHRIGSLPVLEDGELAGIITRSDILEFVLSGERLVKPTARRRPVKQKRAARRRR